MAANVPTTPAHSPSSDSASTSTWHTYTQQQPQRQPSQTDATNINTDRNISSLSTSSSRISSSFKNHPHPTPTTHPHQLPPRRISSSFKQFVAPHNDDDHVDDAESVNKPLTYSNIMHVPSTQYCRPGSWPAFKSNAMAGAFSLSTAFAAMHPLDTIKTQLQASSSAESTIQRIFSRSTARTLLNGFTASIAGAAPQGALRFSTYESTKLKIISNCHETYPYICTPLVSSAISAMAGDMVSSTVKVPREVITQRLQATKMYSSTFDAMHHILKHEGLRGFYTGYWSTQCRDLPFMMFLFSCYENIKSLTGSLCEESSLASAMFGASSGALAGYFTTPMDVIKTRIMTHAVPDTSVAGKKIITLGMRHAARDIMIENNGGWKNLFTGAVPRSVWWFGVCGVFFPLYEVSKAKIHTYHAKKHGHYEYGHGEHDENGVVSRREAAVA